MVWLGMARKEAAHAAGLTEHALYSGLRRPHVKAFYLRELDVLRTSERAKSIHRLVDLRDAANNMVAIQAIRTLERMDDDAERRPAATQHGPGLQIVIVQGDAKPTVDAHIVPSLEDGSAE